MSAGRAAVYAARKGIVEPVIGQIKQARGSMSLFGKKQGIEDHLTYSIQFLQLADEQIAGPLPAADILSRLLS